MSTRTPEALVRGSALAALAIDLVAGEPPAAIHPTVAMGRWIGHGKNTRRSRRPIADFVDGVALVGAGALLSALAALAVDTALGTLPRAMRAAARGAALKPAISVRALLDAATEVEDALISNQIVRARELLSWHLVSRDTTLLSANEIAAATIESVAENFNDALVGPLFAFRGAGLAGAYLFRFVNTADAMLGYRTRELEWFGKFAARFDDVLAFAPARMAAALIGIASAFTGDSPTNALTVAVNDANRTASPNAGWPMAAMAGALGVRLMKRDHYVLNAAARAPGARDIARARRIVLTASGFAALCAELV